MNSEKEVAVVLGQAVVDGKAAMTEMALGISGAVEGLVAAGKAGAAMGETVRNYAVAAMS